jgi:hypothetical protein
MITNSAPLQSGAFCLSKCICLSKCKRDAGLLVLGVPLAVRAIAATLGREAIADSTKRPAPTTVPLFGIVLNRPVDSKTPLWNRFGEYGDVCRELHMPGDPEECRRQGRECVRLAQQATTARARRDYLSLAQTWLQLADIFDSDDARLKRCGKPGSNVVPFAKRTRRPIKLRAS